MVEMPWADEARGVVDVVDIVVVDIFNVAQGQRAAGVKADRVDAEQLWWAMDDRNESPVDGHVVSCGCRRGGCRGGDGMCICDTGR